VVSTAMTGRTRCRRAGRKVCYPPDPSMFAASEFARKLDSDIQLWILPTAVLFDQSFQRQCSVPICFVVVYIFNLWTNRREIEQRISI
jgi:hypothetical protein